MNDDMGPIAHLAAKASSPLILLESRLVKARRGIEGGGDTTVPVLPLAAEAFGPLVSLWSRLMSAGRGPDVGGDTIVDLAEGNVILYL